jgi:Family of unknown function (DUF5988)
MPSHLEPVPPAHTNGQFIDVVLEGGPANLPAELRHCRVAAKETTIKICHYGGHEHFTRVPATEAGGNSVAFHWTGRTRIAE